MLIGQTSKHASKKVKRPSRGRESFPTFLLWREERRYIPDPSLKRQGCAIAIAILGRRPPGFFWLFAIGELVSNKPCVILAASWWVSGEGQCRDETR